MTVLETDAPAVKDAGTYMRISDADRDAYNRDGFLLIPGALSPDLLARAEAAADRVYVEESYADRLRPDKSLHLLGMLDRDPVFLDLLDNPVTFRYVWNLIGWNVYSHHNHLDVHPGDQPPQHVPWNWHQDGYRQNADVDTDPRPMLSLKVGFVLSDLSATSRGATKIIKGSHIANTLAGRPERSDEPYDEPTGAEEIVARAGDAFVFDRRLWHSRSLNVSSVTRKMVFIGYTHRWIRPLDETNYQRDPSWFSTLSPLRQQLLGAGCDNANYWGVEQSGWIDKNIPLRVELANRGLLDGSLPYMR